MPSFFPCVQVGASEFLIVFRASTASGMSHVSFSRFSVFFFFGDFRFGHLFLRLYLYPHQTRSRGDVGSYRFLMTACENAITGYAPSFPSRMTSPCAIFAKSPKTAAMLLPKAAALLPNRFHGIIYTTLPGYSPFTLPYFPRTT